MGAMLGAWIFHDLRWLFKRGSHPRILLIGSSDPSPAVPVSQLLTGFTKAGPMLTMQTTCPGFTSHVRIEIYQQVTLGRLHVDAEAFRGLKPQVTAL